MLNQIVISETVNQAMYNEWKRFEGDWIIALATYIVIISPLYFCCLIEADDDELSQFDRFISNKSQL